ncbi:MAG: hypothetical protein NVS3B10_19400 [Polyangiales bacterium]
MLAVAWTASLAVAGVAVGCDTPPVSPANAGAAAVAPAHPSPDPPPARPVIVEDAAGLDAGRLGTTALDAGGGSGAPGDDAGGDTTDGGAGGAAAGAVDAGTERSALSSAWLSPVSGADTKVAALRPTLRACYMHSIKGRPQGQVVLHASVGADGSVQSVTASDNQGVMGRVVACMIDVLKGAQLPAPGRATTLDVPISFQTP